MPLWVTNLKKCAKCLINTGKTSIRVVFQSVLEVLETTLHRINFRHFPTQAKSKLVTFFFDNRLLCRQKF